MQAHPGVLREPGTQQSIENQRSPMRISEVQELAAEGGPHVRNLICDAERAKCGDRISRGKLRPYLRQYARQPWISERLPEPVRPVPIRPEPPDLGCNKRGERPIRRRWAAERERPTAHTVQLFRQTPDRARMFARGRMPPVELDPHRRLWKPPGPGPRSQDHEPIRNRNYRQRRRHAPSIPSVLVRRNQLPIRCPLVEGAVDAGRRSPANGGQSASGNNRSPRA